MRTFMESPVNPFMAPQENGRRLAKEWFAENRERMQGTFASPSRYDEQRAEFVPLREPQMDKAQVHTENFLRALDIFRNNRKNNLRDDFNLDNAHDWDDVIRQFEHARRRYDGRAKGVRGIARKIGRSVGDNASIIQPLVNLIPHHEYTSTLCCALSLIFGAAGRMSERRKLIFESLGDVPSIIEEADECCDDFATDELLRAEAIELYVTVLIAVMEMMKWLVDKGGCLMSRREAKHMKALLQGPLYAQSIEEKVKDVQKQSESVQNRVAKLTRRAILSMNARTEEHKLQLGDVLARTGEVQEGANVSMVSLQRIEGDINLMKDFMSKSLDERADSEALIRKGIEGQNSLLRVLFDIHQKAEWNEKHWIIEKLKNEKAEKEVETLSAEVRKLNTQRSTAIVLEPAQMLDILSVDLQQVASEVAIVLRRGAAINLSYQNRGVLLLQTAKFQAWQNSAHSERLLVDGNDSSTLSRISAMTIICALLAQSLLDESAASIHFFCGLHSSQIDALSGPRGLLRCLIAQLKIIQGRRVMVMDSMEYNELLHHDFRRLCQVLESLVKQLPANFVLFCLIDGVSFYESIEWREEACQVIDTISILTQDLDVHSTFKVLITSPFASRYVVKRLPKDAHLTLPYDSGLSNQDGLAARSLSMVSRRALQLPLKARDLDTGDLFTAELSDTDEGFVEGSSN